MSSLWDNFTRTSIRILAVSEEEEEQEIENLVEKIMKENPNLAKKIDLQVQKAQRVPKKLDPKKVTPRHIIKMLKVKNKEKILKATREKETVT